MKLPERIEAFCRLGKVIRDLGLGDRKTLAEKAKNENPWFVAESVMLSLKGIEVLLEKDNLTRWALGYLPEPAQAKTIGVTMAGNIPLVGFHDFLCVLMSGHVLKAKLSSQDSVLLKFVLEKLITLEPQFSERVAFAENLKGVDAMIATGSDNTARYFEYYFRNIPHVIRKNRASCAVVLGEESVEEFEQLGRDVFSYFGLGCRNVSKLYVPEDFDFASMIRSLEPFAHIMDHHKYANNYDYQKAALLVNRDKFLEGEFVLIKENTNLVSPIAVLYFEKYKTVQEVKEKIESIKDKLQVVVSAKGWVAGSVAFGKAQLPEVGDYADGVDTMKFLGAVGG